MSIKFPISQMAGAPWNILDDTGTRIAWCGYDNDHEKTGPAIAAELVALARENERLTELYRNERYSHGCDRLHYPKDWDNQTEAALEKIHNGELVGNVGVGDSL